MQQQIIQYQIMMENTVQDLILILGIYNVFQSIYEIFILFYYCKFGFFINLIRCCKDKDDIEYFTPSTLCKHWKIKTDPINVWFILQYQCDEKETIPIAELERKRFERRARSKVPQIYHPIIERKFRPKRISKPKVKEEISISSSEPTTPSLSDLVISPKTDNSDEKSSNEHKQEKVKKTRPKKRIRIRDDSSDEDNNMDEDEDVPIPLSIFNLKL